ncbi:2EXR domain-containing protein [Aspergillus homomorphus CBS 101889]|uniref:2EXR domain-containing protein n=1 Tax=Aspergillus homomorphus (strain CBS 101889) TaxID=1450537 RepID=A0A395IEF1_ASPHC|nr:hypothetical protein BO97DRAFT_474517 [Aspergillus homomorphus CBS 101889]RAL17553.1 hypothetical protein BO97DRAFT_474517 [Aspergillus homomorphus CBS 101889]
MTQSPIPTLPRASPNLSPNPRHHPQRQDQEHEEDVGLDIKEIDKVLLSRLLHQHSPTVLSPIEQQTFDEQAAAAAVTTEYVDSFCGRVIKCGLSGDWAGGEGAFEARVEEARGVMREEEEEEEEEMWDALAEGQLMRELEEAAEAADAKLMLLILMGIRLCFVEFGLWVGIGLVLLFSWIVSFVSLGGSSPSYRYTGASSSMFNVYCHTSQITIAFLNFSSQASFRLAYGLEYALQQDHRSVIRLNLQHFLWRQVLGFHVRLLVLVLSGVGPKPVLRHLFQLVKPGGYLQWDELDCVNMFVETKLDYYDEPPELIRAFNDQHLLTMEEFAARLAGQGRLEAAAQFLQLIQTGYRELLTPGTPSECMPSTVWELTGPGLVYLNRQDALQMSPQPQLQIYNYIASDTEELTFQPFPLLPTELRLKIWQYSLQRPRLIQIGLMPATDTDAPDEPPAKSYRVVVSSTSSLSKLLRVNCEAREAALRFYRVHIPCDFRAHDDHTPPKAGGAFHFNPEYDILQLHARYPVKATLLAFLDDVKNTYDRRGVGLLKLALNLNDLEAHDLGSLDSADVSLRARTAFVETLTQLREVFFMEVARFGRQVLGWYSGLDTPETFFNRSFPIMVTTTTFDRLPRDPRDIAEDLKRVFVGCMDPRVMFDFWGRLLLRWGVSPSHVQYRFLLSFEPTNGQVHDRVSAEKWLLKEDRIWKGEPHDDRSTEERDEEAQEDPGPLGQFLRRWKHRWPVGAKHEKYRNEDLENAVRPAFGFWLFPLEALGVSLDSYKEGGGFIQPEGWQWKAKQLLDLTGHWPELALLGLP